MNLQPRAVALTIGAAVLIVLSITLLRYFPINQAPDFQALNAGEERKQAFFRYFRPLSDNANSAISEGRRRLLTLADADELDWWQRRTLQGLAADYRLDTSTMKPADSISELLLRIDTVPSSLVVAQAAKESGWGSSRFADEGNNYFGQRCWEAGCGLKPQQRETGMQHEVARFRSPYDSVTSYLRNLNSHPDYEALRAVRAQLRASGKTPLGSQLAEELNTYSERRQAYIDEIKKLIRVNKLEQRT
jgi:Bax protein